MSRFAQHSRRDAKRPRLTQLTMQRQADDLARLRRQEASLARLIRRARDPLEASQLQADAADVRARLAGLKSCYLRTCQGVDYSRLL